MVPQILFLYNAVTEDYKKGFFVECMTFPLVLRIQQALEQNGCQVFALNLESKQQLAACLQKQDFDLAFILAEGYFDEPRTFVDGSGAASIREQLHQYGVPFTHSDVSAMEKCRNKVRTYQCLKQAGIAVPDSAVVDPTSTCFPLHLQYPVFIKPAGGGNSLGIDDSSIVYNEIEFSNRVNLLTKQFGNLPLVVETYLPGAEFTVALLGNGDPQVLPILAFPEDYGVRGYHKKKNEFQLRDRFKLIYPDESIYLALSRIAKKTFQAVGAADILRIDLKSDIYGNVYVIDVNGTPAVTSNASLAYIAEGSGLRYENLIGLILLETAKRYGLSFIEKLAQELEMCYCQLQYDFNKDIV